MLFALFWSLDETILVSSKFTLAALQVNGMVQARIGKARIDKDQDRIGCISGKSPPFVMDTEMI